MILSGRLGRPVLLTGAHPSPIHNTCRPVDGCIANDSSWLRPRADRAEGCGFLNTQDSRSDRAQGVNADASRAAIQRPGGRTPPGRWDFTAGRRGEKQLSPIPVPPKRQAWTGSQVRRPQPLGAVQAGPALRCRPHSRDCARAPLCRRQCFHARVPSLDEFALPSLASEREIRRGSARRQSGVAGRGMSNETR